MSQAQERLEYNLEKIRSAIKNSNAIKDVIEHAAELQKLLDSDMNGKLPNVTLLNWTDGYVARDVAEVQALLIGYQTMSVALDIVVENEQR